MKIKLVVLALLVFLVGSTAFSASKYYLPQVAVGSYGDGSFRTTFFFFNNHSYPTSVTLALTNDDGTPMSVTIPGLGTNNTFNFTLTPAGSRILQTDNSGTARAGAATVTSDLTIGVSGLFTIYDKDGKFKTEAGVGSSDPLKSFALPVQITSTYNTGLALFNPSGSSSSITATLTNVDGTVSGTTTFDLAAGKHIGKYVGGDLFKDVSNFQGTLAISSTVAVSAMTLRQISTPLSYTSCPVVSTSSIQTTFNLAQFVNGTSADVGFKTAFMLFNFGTSTANITLTLTKDNGTAFPVVITGQGATAKSSFTFALGAKKSLFLQTDGTGTPEQGAAIISSDVPIGAASIFTQYNGNGSFATEAGAPDSPAYTDLTLPVDSKATADTGIALFNPGTASVTFTPKFLDTVGISTAAPSPITLPAKGHYANFFANIFPNMGSVQGSLTISAPTAISALTMRENLSPFGMTSLPVIEGATAGYVLPTTGTAAPAIVTSIPAAANATVNKTLNLGYKVSYAITGIPVAFSLVLQSGNITYTRSLFYYGFAGLTLEMTGSFYLPPGEYTAKVSAYDPNAGQYTATLYNYIVPETLVVKGDTAFPINVVPPTLYTVAGYITLPQQFASSTVAINFISEDGLVSGQTNIINGGYNVTLPNGKYTVGLLLSGTGVTQTSLGLNNIGQFTVNGNDVDSDIVIPEMATLSGTASFKDGVPSSGSVTIYAADTAAPNATDIYYSRSTSSNIAQTSFPGSYEMLLKKGSSYNLSLAYSVYASTSTTVSSGTVRYTPTSNQVTLNGNSTYNFPEVPAAPSMVTLSGKVTNNTGAAVPFVSITAASSALTGIPNSRFTSATAYSGSDGSFSILVPSGTDYQLTFVPTSYFTTSSQ
jgi:hypothetical protein